MGKVGRATLSGIVLTTTDPCAPVRVGPESCWKSRCKDRLKIQTNDGVRA